MQQRRPDPSTPPLSTQRCGSYIIKQVSWPLTQRRWTSKKRRAENWTFLRFKVPREVRDMIHKLWVKVEGDSCNEYMAGYLLLDALKYLDDCSPQGIHCVPNVELRPIGEGRQAPVLRLVQSCGYDQKQNKRTGQEGYGMGPSSNFPMGRLISIWQFPFFVSSASGF